jgi:hypothetical protein
MTIYFQTAYGPAHPHDYIFPNGIWASDTVHATAHGRHDTAANVPCRHGTKVSVVYGTPAWSMTRHGQVRGTVAGTVPLPQRLFWSLAGPPHRAVGPYKAADRPAHP